MTLFEKLWPLLERPWEEIKRNVHLLQLGIALSSVAALIAVIFDKELIAKVILTALSLSAFILYAFFRSAWWEPIPWHRLRIKRFSINMPCPFDQIAGYHELLKKYFGDNLIPTETALRAGLERNNYSLILIQALGQDRIVGGIELYGLRSEFMNEYIKGSVTDSDFGDSVFAAVEEIATAQASLYAAIAIERLPLREVEKIRDHLLAATVHILREKYFSHPEAPSKLTIYALGATLGGITAAKTLGFELISPKRGRKDKKDLYRMEVSKLDLEILSRNYPIIPRLLTLIVSGREAA